MAEVLGSSIQTIIDGVGKFQRNLTKILNERGITDVDPIKWYDLSIVEYILKHFADTGLNGGILHEVGKHVPHNAQFPPQIDTFEKVLLSLDVAYKMNHRGDGLGEYRVRSTNGEVYIDCDTPVYPCKYNQGLIRGLANKFGAKFLMKVLDTSGGGKFMVKIF